MSGAWTVVIGLCVGVFFVLATIGLGCMAYLWLEDGGS